jgi:hypothetical protein
MGWKFFRISFPQMGYDASMRVKRWKDASYQPNWIQLDVIGTLTATKNGK